jgi:hypothetical protein
MLFIENLERLWIRRIQCSLRSGSIKRKEFLEGFESSLQRFQMCIFFFATEALPAPFKGEGRMIIGKALDEAVSTPLSRCSTCCSGPAFDQTVVLP